MDKTNDEKICIIDAGCAGGIDPLFYNLLEINKAYGYGFDANENEIAKLLKKKNLNNINYIHQLISYKPGKSKFYKSGTVGSVFKREDREKFFSEQYEEKEIKTISIDSFINEKKINDLIVLKVDIEGSEINLINGADYSLQNQIICVKIEFNFHSKKNTNNFHDIHRSLTNFDFQLISFNTNESNLFGIDSGDALYLKKPNKKNINKMFNKNNINSYIDVLMHLNKREFALLTLQNTSSFFSDQDYKKIKQKIVSKVFINDTLNFSYPRLSMFFFYISMFFAGNKYKTKSFPKLNRIKQSNFLFKRVYSKNKAYKYLNNLEKKIQRYNFIDE
jgi:FkbM family methyltransferase